MIAKLIVHDADRAARARPPARGAGRSATSSGRSRNIEFLERLVRHPAVVDGTHRHRLPRSPSRRVHARPPATTTDGPAARRRHRAAAGAGAPTRAARRAPRPIRPRPGPSPTAGAWATAAAAAWPSCSASSASSCTRTAAAATTASSTADRDPRRSTAPARGRRRPEPAHRRRGAATFARCDRDARDGARVVARRRAPPAPASRCRCIVRSEAAPAAAATGCSRRCPGAWWWCKAARGRRGRRRPGADGDRSDEDGAEPEGAARRRASAEVRAAAGDFVEADAVLVTLAPMKRLSSASSKSARATACRTRRPPIATADKIELIDRLSATGLRTHRGHQLRQPEVGAAAGRRRRGVRRHPRRPGVRYPVLVPNEQGYDRARAVGVEEIAVFTAASEAFNRKNINAGIDESLAALRPGARARAAPTACACAATSPPCSAARTRARCRSADVVRVARALARHGLLRDLARRHHRRRHARARRARCCSRWRRKCRCRALAVHFHDTYGQALANILACLEEGVRGGRLVRVRHRRLPVRQGRQRQRRQRGRRLHAARPRHRDRHRPGQRWPIPAAGSPPCSGAKPAARSARHSPRHEPTAASGRRLDIAGNGERAATLDSHRRAAPSDCRCTRARDSAQALAGAWPSDAELRRYRALFDAVPDPVSILD